MSRARDACALHQVTRRALEPEPEDVGSYGNADRLGKGVHEAGRRQVGDARQRLQRQTVQRGPRLLKPVQHAPDSGMDRDGAPPVHEELDQPTFGTRIVRRAAEHGAPPGNLAGRDAGNLALDALRERTTHVALRADEPDQ
jgi:hypothetical protein